MGTIAKFIIMIFFLNSAPKNDPRKSLIKDYFHQNKHGIRILRFGCLNPLPNPTPFIFYLEFFHRKKIKIIIMNIILISVFDDEFKKSVIIINFAIVPVQILKFIKIFEIFVKKIFVLKK